MGWQILLYALACINIKRPDQVNITASPPCSNLVSELLWYVYVPPGRYRDINSNLTTTVLIYILCNSFLINYPTTWH
jgi:hypothetical protein